MMMKVLEFVESKQNNEFYPTPESLVKRMLDGIDWNSVQTVLEPSAGKGDILRVLSKKAGELDIDCIELDSSLRQILKYNFSEDAKQKIYEQKRQIAEKHRYIEQDWKSNRYKYYNSESGRYEYLPEPEQERLSLLDSKLECFFKNGIHIVHDDFLTYTPYKRYDLIIMNPPFSNGDKHLLKALEIQKNGGSIVCLLNAETIRNPYTESRKSLAQLLDKYNASIEYIENSFSFAERRTDVEIALVKVCIPVSDSEKSIFEKIAKKKNYAEPEIEAAAEIEVTDFIQAAINRYKVEIESGIELIKTYERMKPYLNRYFSETDVCPIISLTDGQEHKMTINSYVKAVRLKYWKALLTNEKFIGRLTSKLQQEYRERVASYADYDFSEFNIQTLALEMSSKVKTGIEEEAIKMYDRLTEEHACYPECTKNRYLYDGWKTNKAWKLDKKVIIPCYGIYDRWDGRPRVYEAHNLIADIERVLNFFDGNMTADIDLYNQINIAFNQGVTKKIKCKFFSVTFYKKGTVHIEFTCPELIDRFNIYAAQNKKWLPPSYGKKQYKDMTEEERTVIDSFQGENSYNKIMERKNYYLSSPAEVTRTFLAIA